MDDLFGVLAFAEVEIPDEDDTMSLERCEELMRSYDCKVGWWRVERKLLGLAVGWLLRQFLFHFVPHDLHDSVFFFLC